MAVDLDIICVKDGIPIDMHFFDEMFFDGVSEFPRDVLDWLMANKQPVFVKDRNEYFSKRGEEVWDYEVWEITKSDAKGILGHLNNERGHRERGRLDGYECRSKMDDWGWFTEGKKVFIVG